MTMTLQKLIHSPEDVYPDLTENVELIHIVNEVFMGGEFTLCGRAIPDASIKREGWKQVGSEFKGRKSQCNCSSCLRILAYYKKLF